MDRIPVPPDFLVVPQPAIDIGHCLRTKRITTTILRSIENSRLRIDQAKRLKELEQENSKLRKVIADLTIDNAILKEAARGNW